MQTWMDHLIAILALPQAGLSTVFVVSFISATLVPLGSEPAVFALIKIRPDLFWPTIAVATAGNTLGGGLGWLMGRGSLTLFKSNQPNAMNLKALSWLQRLGPPACLLAWLPGVGDPLCVVAGWLKLPFWPCLAYMAVGKLARYLVMTGALLWLFPNLS